MLEETIEASGWTLLLLSSTLSVASKNNEVSQHSHTAGILIQSHTWLGSLAASPLFMLLTFSEELSDLLTLLLARI